MSKKKSRHKKKRTIRTSQGSVAAPKTQVTAAQSQPEATPVKKTAPVVDTVVTDEWAYVRTDMRQILILAAGCIGVELLLWWALTSTSLGPSVYNLIQL